MESYADGHEVWPIKIRTTSALRRRGRGHLSSGARILIDSKKRFICQDVCPPFLDNLGLSVVSTHCGCPGLVRVGSCLKSSPDNQPSTGEGLIEKCKHPYLTCKTFFVTV